MIRKFDIKDLHHCIKLFQKSVPILCKNEIYTFSSISAKNFFLKANFKIIKENIVLKNQQKLKNFLIKRE
ncbi:hypothetical protein OJO96_05045 [Campylobacter lari]|uniref:hypothetical protein n=1 Tax=Campylobacter TaxID=194 RepID=UPI00189E59F1|nr:MULTISPECIES: hypothetical protein [Campylobacter]MBF7045501.1 hypothetical protein [Campylobacter volucris]MCW0227026.1 hypothetical protein [Campylobacter lari]